MDGGTLFRRWVPTIRSLGTDAPLAAVVALLGQLEVRLFLSGFAAVVAGLLYLVCSAGIALRRRYPLGAALAVMVAGHLAMIAGVPRGRMIVLATAFLIAAYSVAAYGETRRARIGLATIIPLGWAGVLLTPGSKEFDNYPFVALLFGGAWGLGRLVHRRLEEAVAMERRALQAEREREDAARSAVVEERSRIARELHDIVAHGLSLMIVQAAAAEQVLARDPQRAVTPLRAIQQAGREALGDMKRLLGVLRVEEHELDLVPQPSLAHVDRLVAHLGETGLPVELRVEGDVRPLPAGLDMCGYRVVQEALTNSLKHGRPRTTSVLVRYGAVELEVEVVDDGVGDHPDGPLSPGRDGARHGLIGMRERVALYGGVLEVGGRPEGGYAVRARLPLEQV